MNLELELGYPVQMITSIAALLTWEEPLNNGSDDVLRMDRCAEKRAVLSAMAGRGS